MDNNTNTSQTPNTENKYDKYLQIGSVVLLKNAKKRIMVIGFAAKSKENVNTVFDYIGCLYPEGVLSSDKNLLFNHDQIDKIYCLGYSDQEDQQFRSKLNDFVANNMNNNNN